MFENRVLRRIFGVTGEWRKLHNGELYDLYLSPDIIRQENEVGSACGMHGRGRNMYRILVGEPEGKNHLKDQGVGGRMGSKWTLGRLVGGGGWSGFNWLSMGTGGGLSCML
jgi:hypothetical protein